MKSRIFKQLAWMGALFAVYGHSQSCNNVVLYDGTSQSSGKIESSSMTFPEYPEWTTNWGDFENMHSPYMRFSGQKNTTGDWKAAITFNRMPLNVNGGALKLKVRATQNAKFALWISGNSGTSQVYAKDLTANQTSALDVPLSQLIGNTNVQVEKIWIALQNVPTYQYTTLFIDDVELTCATDNSANISSEVSYASGNGLGNESSENTVPYTFIEGAPFPEVPSSSMLNSEEERSALLQQTKNPSVISYQEHRQIMDFQSAKKLSAQKSRDGWYNSMVIIEYGRLRDSLFKNPKNIFLDAGNVAATYGLKKVPILIADLDYSYKVCNDTMCTGTTLKDQSLLLTGLPTPYVKGSKIQLVYDPYFVVSTRNSLPTLEVCIGTKCQSLKANSEINVEFESAGLQKITVKATSGTQSVTQTLFLEVK